MLVTFTEVAGSPDRPVGTVEINPRHVVLVRRGGGVSERNPDAQVFMSQVVLVTGISLMVEGTPSVVRAHLNHGSSR